ncbi:coiled-coil protein [Rhynchospora pubera]|uniref:Coiled-coil protein n=1 Tax=Rhynchospora pubera TaxID=906938 RepID=A0AAV8D1Z7_9POAL|nr:coiled-coil protein [Rhynchospora pubera]
MSFLAGRLAATEGAFFLQESKNAAGRLADNLPPSTPSPIPSPPSADVLPEVLRHSIPIKRSSKPSDPSLSTASPSKWILHHDGSASASANPNPNPNPLRAYVSLPPATFGPKRWQIPSEHPHFSASTANDLRLRRDQHPISAPPDPEKLKALMRGYSQIAKAFAAATLLVFGGVTALSLYTAHKLDLHSANDVRTKGRDAIQPQVNKLKERMSPLRTWAENVSRRWHIDENKEAKEHTMIKEFSKAIGVKTSN